MPQRIVPNKVVTVTQDGVCQVAITLDLNINITGGEIRIAAGVSETPADNTDWVLPDLRPPAPGLVNFGRDVPPGG
jgi:hypothetical protein